MPTPSTPRTRRHVSTPLTRLALMAALCVGLAACDASQAQDKKGPAGAVQQAPTVTVAKPEVRDISDFKEFTGRFEAKESVEIRARVGGYLTKTSFQEGAIVKKGDLLFVIDQRPYEAALKKAEAAVKVAASQLAFAKGNYERAQSLFASGDVSAQLRDQRLQERDTAAATLDSAKAAAETARLDLSYTKIASPLDGRIGQKLVSDGNLVEAGQTLLTTIMSLDPIYFYFDIDQQTYLDYARAHPDQKKDALDIPVTLSLTDKADYSLQGHIDFVDNTLDASTGSMRARAVLANPKLYLTPGMFGRIRVVTGARPKAVLIPDAAVMIDQSRKYVYTVDGKGQVASRTVETGNLSDDGLRVITTGLDGSETIIVNGLQRAHDGGTVTPETAQPAQAGQQTAQP